MKMNKIVGLLCVPVFLGGVFVVPSSARAQSASPQETLNQYVADLQKNPDDTALREKIIALALTMNPPPEVPAEAKRHMSRGVAAVEGAKTPDDFRDACNEFRQATTLAPWLANAYRNLAIAQDKAGMYDDALASLRLYLLTRPSSADADWAEDLKSKVEYRKEKAAKEVEAKARESSPEAIAAKKQSEFEAFLNKIDGRRYEQRLIAADGRSVGRLVVDVRRGRLVVGRVDEWRDGEYFPGYRGYIGPEYNFAIQGFETTVPLPHPNFARRYWVEDIWTISEDGVTITWRTRGSDGRTEDTVFTWQR